MSQDLEAGLFIGFILGAALMDGYALWLLRAQVRKRRRWYDQYYAEKYQEHHR